MIVEKYTVSMHTKALKAHIPSGLKQVFRQISGFGNKHYFFTSASSIFVPSGR